MVQEQLIDYVSSQIKLGVSREAIKSTLISAGWVSADVEDTLKKVEGSSPVQAVSVGSLQAAMAAKPMSSSSSVNPSASVSQGGAKAVTPLTIKVSDLVSATTTMSPASSGAAMKSDKLAGVKTITDVGNPPGKIMGNSFQAASPYAGKSSKMGLILAIVGGVLIVALAALAFYFYSQNSGLAAQIKTLDGSAGGVNTQLSSLQAQLTASNQSFTSQISTLNATNAELALELSFYAVPPSGTAGTALPIALTGTLSGGGKIPYAITGMYGAKIFVTNKTSAQIMADLGSLVGQSISVTGAYVPGSQAMTVLSITSPVPATTMTSASTTSSASSTTTH